MGSSQSSPITAKGSKGSNAVGGRGRKTSSSSPNTKKPKSAPHGLTSSIVSLPSELLHQVCGDITEEPTGSYDDSVEIEEAIESDDDSDEEDPMELERQLALNDARQLKQLAAFFLHPEVPVSSEGHSRCYFERASAPEPDTLDQAEEKANILRDAAALKQAAKDFLHPELPVTTTDPSACGRNFYDRPSAVVVDDAEEREMIIAEAKALKKLAVDYMHPELPVVTSDPTACARCFYDRPSGPEPIEDAEEYGRIMGDIKGLKSSAKDFLHPELPVVTNDATATARCFFDRASAPEVSSKEEEEEISLIMADCAAMKKLAVDFKHPELPVSTQPTAFARCYFDRASAPAQLSEDDANEMALILQDAAALKKAAVDYLHPEIPVKTSDPCATARCFFDRASAPYRLTTEEAEERAQVLRDAAVLKELAVDYLHPELPVVATDSTATARCFFDRLSAPTQLSVEEAQERDAILADLKALSQTATDFLHPERPVATTDSTATARCFFDRYSAVPQESKEEMDDRVAALSNAMALRNLAVDFMHPERSVVSSDPTAAARCFFNRPSAPEVETPEEHEERLQVLADINALKKLAMDFLHPEVTLATTCPYANGRNYFDRPSAKYHDRMIHTFPPHEHDDVDHHHEHTDHFGMEDFYMGDTSPSKIADGNVDFSQVDFSKVTDELEGNLSRSPSSVMLYGQEEY